MKSLGVDFHRHLGHIEIIYCVRGAFKICVEDRAFSVKSGEFVALSPKMRHHMVDNPSGMKLYWLMVRLPKSNEGFFELTREERSQLLKRLEAICGNAVATSDVLCAQFKQAFKLLRNSTAKHTVLGRLELRTQILSLLLKMCEGAVQDNVEVERRVKYLTLQMRRHPEKDWTEKELSRVLHCSPNTVLDRFRQLTGYPPHVFLLKCRVREAMRCLRKDPSLKITDLAYRLGFSSSQHFSTRFREETGLSPRDWCRAECI